MTTQVLRPCSAPARAMAAEMVVLPVPPEPQQTMTDFSEISSARASPAVCTGSFTSASTRPSPASRVLAEVERLDRSSREPLRARPSWSGPSSAVNW